MIDTLMCIVYIFVGAKWVLKKVEIETISAPTNWKIIVLKFLIWLVVPSEIFIYIYFLNKCMNFADNIWLFDVFIDIFI